jgi:hypothetical protein
MQAKTIQPLGIAVSVFLAFVNAGLVRAFALRFPRLITMLHSYPGAVTSRRSSIASSSAF